MNSENMVRGPCDAAPRKTRVEVSATAFNVPAAKLTELFKAVREAAEEAGVDDVHICVEVR